MKIVLVEAFGRGGLAHYVRNLAQALHERNHDVTILTSGRWEHVPEESGEEAARSGPTLRTRLAPWGSRGEPALRFLSPITRKLEALLDCWRIARFVGRQQADIVHVHSTQPIAALELLLVRLFSRRRPETRVVYTAHVVTPHEPMRFGRTVFGFTARRAHRVIAHSRHDLERLVSELEIDRERIAVIPHGDYGFFADLAPYTDRAAAREQLGIAGAAPTALFFGYLRQYKGLDVLMDSWDVVRREQPSARLMLVGDPVRLRPEHRRELEARAGELGVITRMQYVPIEEVALYCAAADFMVLPYHRVSQSGVLYLALALGLPVIATRVGAWREMLTDGEDALLVPAGDEQALAAAITRLASEPELRRRLAAGGHELAERHSWKNVAESTEALYSQSAHS